MFVGIELVLAVSFTWPSLCACSGEIYFTTPSLQLALKALYLPGLTISWAK